MLVLNRKANEKVAIEGGITVSVLAVEGGRVRLGVAVRILRVELAFCSEQETSRTDKDDPTS